MTQRGDKTRRQLKPVVQDAAWQQKQRVWRHNALSGHAAMMLAQCRNIAAADSTTAQAKEFAERIAELVQELALALKTRVDP